MRNIKSYIKITLLILPIIFYLANPSSVRSFSPTGTLSIGLYYENGQLLEMEDDGTWVFSTQPYITPEPQTYPLYTAELYGVNSNLLTAVLVNQRNTAGVDVEGNPLMKNGSSGQVMVTIPFEDTLTRIVFKNEKNQTEADITVDPSYFCNFNNVCEVQFGENGSSCSADCQPSPTYIPVSVQPSPSVTPTASRNAWKIILPLLIWFGLAIVLGVGWFIIKKRVRPY